ncbi:MAG: LytR/AlgR family response regulator transcription factor [Candidatus Cryptobacteroides sp.]
MKKIKAVIIEDEIPAARLLMSMVTALRPEWDVETVPGDIDDAVEWFAGHPHPDLIFLDIHLVDGDAFDFLSAAKPKSSIIFTTAYDQYAIKAFSFNSIAYILKPVDEDKLSEALNKYEKLGNKSIAVLEHNLDVILETLRTSEKKYRNRFIISAGDDLMVLQSECISYFYTEGKVTYAVTSSGKEYAIDVALNRLEEQLNPEQFFRANRQIILNIDSIERATCCSKGRIMVKVQPPFRNEIIVSEARATSFRIWLNY